MKFLTLALFINILFFQNAQAQEESSALVPLPSVEDFTRGKDGWGAGLGLGVEYESAYEGSDEFGLEVDPTGAVQWRKGDNIFYWAGEALGWRGVRDSTWFFDVAISFEEGREEGDSDDGRLNGLGDAEESLELVLQARRAFDINWQYWLDGRLVSGDNGSLGIFGVGRRFSNQKDGTGPELALVMVYHDSKRANTDFGVDAMQSIASGLVETELSAGIRSIALHYNYRTYFKKNWQVFVEVLYEHYLGDIKDSPISRKNYEAEVGVGFIYVF